MSVATETEVGTGVIHRVTVHYRCSRCGNTWGAKAKSLENAAKMPPFRLVCNACGSGKLGVRHEHETSK